jgi:hypothetical protein
MKLKTIISKHPILCSFIFIIFLGLLNITIDMFVKETNLVSVNYMWSIRFYGSLLFPLFYVLNFIYIFVCQLLLETKYKIIGKLALFVYILSLLPIINLNYLKL